MTFPTLAGLAAACALTFATLSPAAQAAGTVASTGASAASDDAVSYHTVDVNGVKIFYREAGPKNAPPCCCSTASRPRRRCSAT